MSVTEVETAWSGEGVARMGTETGTVHEEGERCQGQVLESLQVMTRK